MTCRWQGALVVLALLALLAITAGCTETPAEDRCRVADDGRLSLSLAGGGDRSIEVLERDGNFSLSRAVFSSGGVPVTAYIGAPARPAAVGIVYVPGANEPVSGHCDRFRRYADAGIAFLYLDVRGNGFETPGARTDLGAEYREFERGGFPQSYRVIADILRARALLADGTQRWQRRSSRRSRGTPGSRRRDTATSQASTRAPGSSSPPSTLPR